MQPLRIRIRVLVWPRRCRGDLVPRAYSAYLQPWRGEGGGGPTEGGLLMVRNLMARPVVRNQEGPRGCPAAHLDGLYHRYQSYHYLRKRFRHVGDWHMERSSRRLEKCVRSAALSILLHPAQPCVPLGMAIEVLSPISQEDFQRHRYPASAVGRYHGVDVFK